MRAGMSRFCRRMPFIPQETRAASQSGRRGSVEAGEDAADEGGGPGAGEEAVLHEEDLCRAAVREGEHGGDAGCLAPDAGARDAIGEGLGLGEGDSGVGGQTVVLEGEAPRVQGGHAPLNVRSVGSVHIVVNDGHLGAE